MNARADLERELLDEESLLAQVTRLLEQRVDPAEWPPPARSALALALEDPAMSTTESWKAVVLRRHLFGPAGAVPARIAATPQPSSLDRKLAERLRSGLPGLVRYRAAIYLLPAEER